MVAASGSEAATGRAEEAGGLRCSDRVGGSGRERRRRGEAATALGIPFPASRRQLSLPCRPRLPLPVLPGYHPTPASALTPAPAQPLRDGG